MTDLETKGNAMLAELSAQRDALGSRAAMLAGELALSQAKVKDLEGKLAPKPAENVVPITNG